MRLTTARPLRKLPDLVWECQDGGSKQRGGESDGGKRDFQPLVALSVPDRAMASSACFGLHSTMQIS
jgi:hypothetical protein